MTSFDASASALGFSYQLRWALLELLRAVNVDQAVRLSLEVLDDVALTDEAGRPLKAVQLKHHASGPNLSDGSVDLWKTLRVWLESPSLADPNGPILWLVTTVAASDDSAAALLGPDHRDELKAYDRLQTAANDLTSKSTSKYRAIWRDAEEPVKRALLRRVRICGEAPDVATLSQELENFARSFVYPQHLQGYVEQLWGWWDLKCVALLSGERSSQNSVSAAQLAAKIRELRDPLVSGALVHDLALLEVSDEEIEFHSDKLFVEQLKWIKIHGVNFKRAVIDYHRAYAQITRWVEDGDLVEVEVQDFEKRVLDEWSVHYEDMCDRLELEGNTDPQARVIAGRELYTHLRELNEVLIRQHVDEGYVGRGMRNMLADGGRLGWHPDFAEMVQAAAAAVKA